MMKNINIYVSTFGNRIIRMHNAVPIEVGARQRNNFLYETRDDVGDNISELIEFYGELTGLYWIWKNRKIGDDDIVGFCHFNKKLDIKNKDAVKFLTENKNAWVVSKAVSIPKHKSDYEVRVFENILKDNGDYETWRSIYNADASSDNCFSAQMFITSGSEFKRYCEYIFPILERFRAENKQPSDEKYYRRFCAFFGERMLSLYIKKTSRQYLEVDKAYKYSALKKAFGKIFGRDTYVYKKLQGIFGNKSSWKK